jgi:hypothetical protein
MVDDLNAFEREYRSRLKAYLEGQLRELEAGASHGGPFGGGPGNTGPQPAQPPVQHTEVRNGQPPAVGASGGNTGQNPFPQQGEPQHAQHATGGFHTADQPPHDRR